MVRIDRAVIEAHPVRIVGAVDRRRLIETEGADIRDLVFLAASCSGKKDKIVWQFIVRAFNSSGKVVMGYDATFHSIFLNKFVFAFTNIILATTVEEILPLG